MKIKNIVVSKLIAIVPIILIILLGAFLRFYGINWDQDFHLHPDERFLTMVETSISPVANFGEYFNTSISRLNPHNILDANGNSVFPFFVYGTLPLFLVRYVAGWTAQTGYGQVFMVGRYLSGLADVGTIALIFFASRKIFTKKWPSYVAAFLYACSVLPIQISHYFIVDNFSVFFSTLALFAAINIWKTPSNEEAAFSYQVKPIREVFDFKGFRNYAVFAFAFGMALASKVNTGVIIIFLPLAIIFNDPAKLNNTSSPIWKRRFHHLIFAGIISFVVFRIFQPYAFSGPGFFNILPNSKWIDNLRELAALSSGNSNYPPSLQWARRSFWFPIKNMVVWGMGLPQGIFGFLGLILMGWKIIHGELKKYGLIWFFAVVYIIWQASLWNPTMRYFLLVYPAFSILAAWFLYQGVKYVQKVFFQKNLFFKKLIIFSFSAILLLGTLIWAIAFLNVYQQPMTRIAASEWIYENLESAINLSFQDEKGDFSQPLPYSHFSYLNPGIPFEFTFVAEKDGYIQKILIDHIVSQDLSDDSHDLTIQLVKKASQEVILEETINDAFQRQDDSRGKEFVVELGNPYEIREGDEYYIKFNLKDDDSPLIFSGYLSVATKSGNLDYQQPVFEFVKILDDTAAYQIPFSPFRDGEISGLNFYRIKRLDKTFGDTIISVELVEEDTDKVLGTWEEQFHASGSADFRGSSLEIKFKEPIPLDSEKNYTLSITVPSEGTIFVINGSKPAKETDWDDVLPLYMHGLNPFDLREGIYPSDLNFQMYWDDNQEKLERFIDNLSRADTVIITSSRQWGSTTQIPERYPLTTLFYSELIGCPTDDVQWCYSVAEKDMFIGTLGFELVKTFQVQPALNSLKFNSQFAEEAFTVYDHPKVLIFRKTNEFDIQSVIEKFSKVNLSQVINLSPKEAEERPGNLLLKVIQVSQQKKSGTWSELFDYDAIQNKYPLISVLIWYLAISLLGWIFYPLIRIIYKGLPDRGYPLSKLTGMLLITLPIWLAASLGFTFGRPLILFAVLIAVILNSLIFLKNKQVLIDEIKENYRYFINIELIFLLFFVFFLLIRLGNPDLWHPYKGGEKPMDFSYFNAVLKSIHFPPYDPWYSGGYINYYYYGFVIAAVPVKLMGLVPSIAYNLILPTFFSFTASGAFSFGWNVLKKRNGEISSGPSSEDNNKKKILHNPYFSAFIFSAFVIMIGNLGTVKMFFQGVFNLGLDALALRSGNLIQTLQIYFAGFRQFFDGARLNYYPGDWYWIPSRAIPGEPITEFPFFTFLYGDLHAHLFAYPITLMALCWSLSILFGKIKFTNYFEGAIKIISGALIIGSLRATNTWDYPTYLGIAICIIAFYGMRYINPPKNLFGGISVAAKRLIVSAIIISLLVVLTIVLYYPFIKWFGQGYSAIDLWKGDKTPIGSYLIHWGLFMFIIYSWLGLQVYQWMASTPLSALKPLYPYRNFLGLLFVLLLIIAASGFIWGVKIIMIVFPALIALSLLILRKNILDSERVIYFLLIAGLMLTLIVEIVVIRGDIGRMNTVFKFYLQAWTLLALGSAFAFYETIKYLSEKGPKNRLISGWKVFLVLLLFSTSLFTITASIDKITDRISHDTPLTLDGMLFMKHSTYPENEVLMDLSQDYEAIRWMQENIEGTPTIVEANLPEYRWGNRYSIFTGLPGVVGWNWHQRQQRAINPSEWVTERVNDIEAFYTLDDKNNAEEFLKNIR